LEGIGEDTNTSVMTSLIKSKLHKNFLMEITKQEEEDSNKKSHIRIHLSIILGKTSP
jgi:hypothetical protein